MTNLKDLKHIALRGEGYFCIVKKYEDETNKKSYALKELKKEHYSNEEYRYRLLREIKLLEDLQECPNIIGLIDYGNDLENQKLWYLMPLAPYNLFDYIRKNNDKIDLSERYNLAEQIIYAIKFAHSKGILHRDISPNNVLIFLIEDKKLIKVCDFGLGKNKDSLSYYTTSSASGYGQILYVSP
jgi:serine/threonine protein kinase